MRQASRGIVGMVAVALGLLAFVPWTGAAQDATPAACPTTTPEQNETLITDLYKAVAAGEDVAPFLAAEHTVHLPSGRDEVDSIAGWAVDYRDDFANLSITVDQIIAEGDLVAIYSTWSGTQQDDNEQRGFPLTGKDAEWAQTTFFRVECGKIVEVWPIVDLLGQLTDLGIITEAEWQSADGAATPTP